MENKLRQITDSIHGTIYFSSLESELMSTPYFYRLHDIYQNSTVYITFPCNRTKRYEHSLGTMEVASSMLFSSVVNADYESGKVLFEKLNGYFEEIVRLVIYQGTKQDAEYFVKIKNELGNLINTKIEKKNYLEKVNQIIENTVKKHQFNDKALDSFQYYPNIHSFETQDMNISKQWFLYRCLLQAIRIVALFHDVGHPPYSHIIELAMDKLYKKFTSTESFDEKMYYNQEKKEELQECLKLYFDKEQDATVGKMLFSDSVLDSSQNHEKIGLSMLKSTIHEVIPKIIEQIFQSKIDNDSKIAYSLYYITIVEFAIAILVEKDLIFQSFHKIVDGIIDSDRLDYVVRDSQNSGVDWGTVPYKRLVNSAKLFYMKEGIKPDKDGNYPFIIAYPKKILGDIEDMLLTRYKIFARINYHHRCIKTSMAMMSVVFNLSLDYLSNDSEEECINSDINILWTALDNTITPRKQRIIQWNDSWLISVLHKALVNLYKKEELNNTQEVLKADLEEILLGKKKFYSLLKREFDNQKFVDKVIELSGITIETLEELRLREGEKYYNANSKDGNILEIDRSNAEESLRRINGLIQGYKNYDLDVLCEFIPLKEDNLESVLKKVLDKEKFNNLQDYRLYINKGKYKYGLPGQENDLDYIYLYEGNKCVKFDDNKSLRKQILAIAKNVPLVYVYVAPKENIDIKELSEVLMNAMAKAVAVKFKERYEELFQKKLSNN